MNRLFVFFAAFALVVPVLHAAAPDLYSTDCWEIEGAPGRITWVEIHNRAEAPSTGVAHVSILTRKKGAPASEVEWLVPYIAITTEALQRSVLRPFKTRSVYPERYLEAYKRWQADEQSGTAAICSNSLQDALKQKP